MRSLMTRLSSLHRYCRQSGRFHPLSSFLLNLPYPYPPAAPCFQFSVGGSAPEISPQGHTHPRGSADEDHSGPLPGGQLCLPVRISLHRLSALFFQRFVSNHWVLDCYLFLPFQESWTRAPRRRRPLTLWNRRRFSRRPARSAPTSTAFSPPITTGIPYPSSSSCLFARFPSLLVLECSDSCFFDW